MRISDWSSDVCSSDLSPACLAGAGRDALQSLPDCRCAPYRFIKSWGKRMIEEINVLGVYMPAALAWGVLAAVLVYIVRGLLQRLPGYRLLVHPSLLELGQIGRASCRERVCKYV